MKHILSIIVVLFIIPFVCFAQTSDDDKYEQAEKYYDAKEYENAIPIFNELAKSNHAKSLNLLGHCYRFGKGVTVNKEEAFKYYKRSADLGWRAAQYNIAYCYREGIGISQDKEKSYIWFEKAFIQYKELAEKGDAKSQSVTGVFY